MSAVPGRSRLHLPARVGLLSLGIDLTAGWWGWLTQNQWVDNYDAAFQAQPKTPWSTAAITDMSGKSDGRYSESLNKIIGAVKYQRYYKKDAAGPDYRRSSKVLVKNEAMLGALVVSAPFGGPLLGALFGAGVGALGSGMNCESRCTAEGYAKSILSGAATGLIFGLAGKSAGKVLAAVLAKAKLKLAGLKAKPAKAPEEAGVPFRSDTTHIFRRDRGHFSEDTPENKALIQSAIKEGTVESAKPLSDGNILIKYVKNLPDGNQVRAEVCAGEITNAGINMKKK